MVSRSEVVLVPFPFTDLSTTRTRPAVVVCTEDYADNTGDIIVAMITGQSKSFPTDYGLKDWQIAGLLYPSWVRAKVVSLEQSLILLTVGKLSDQDMQEVDARLRLAMGL